MCTWCVSVVRCPLSVPTHRRGQSCEESADPPGLELEADGVPHRVEHARLALRSRGGERTREKKTRRRRSRNKRGVFLPACLTCACAAGAVFWHVTAATGGSNHANLGIVSKGRHQHVLSMLHLRRHDRPQKVKRIRRHRRHGRRHGAADERERRGVPLVDAEADARLQGGCEKQRAGGGCGVRSLSAPSDCCVVFRRVTFPRELSQMVERREDGCKRMSGAVSVPG